MVQQVVAVLALAAAALGGVVWYGEQRFGAGHAACQAEIARATAEKNAELAKSNAEDDAALAAENEAEEKAIAEFRKSASAIQSCALDAETAKSLNALGGEQ